jgi:ribosomal protein S27E
VHRGRFGGNARKRKAKLTDATFQAMIGATPLADAPVATILPDTAELDEGLVEDEFVAVDVVLEHRVIELASVRKQGFRTQDYQFGYVTCNHCHNEQVYYVHQAALASGYTFRCRICQIELTISLQA